jgi:hypothetical protein
MLRDNHRNAISLSKRCGGHTIGITEVGVNQVKRKSSPEAIDQRPDGQIVHDGLRVVQRTSRPNTETRMEHLDTIFQTLPLNLSKPLILARGRKRRTIGNRRNDLELTIVSAMMDNSLDPKSQSLQYIVWIIS